MQRHSKRSGNTAVNRQKQHFAKIRSRTQNGSSPQIAPFRPSFLREDDNAPAGDVTPFGGGSTRHSWHAKGHQTALHECQSVAPAIERLGAMKRGRPGISNRHTVAKQARDRKHASPEAIPALSPRDVAEPNLEAASHLSKEAAQKKRRHPDSSAEEDLLDASRRRLLKQNDWVGLAPSRPLHMNFWSAGEKAKIGKRRKIDKGKEQRQMTVGNPVDAPVMGKEFDSRARFMRAAPVHGAESINIRIGTDALFSQTSIHRSQQDQPAMPDPKHSSETMLFDEESWAVAKTQHDHDSLRVVNTRSDYDSLYDVTPRASPKEHRITGYSPTLDRMHCAASV